MDNSRDTLAGALIGLGATITEAMNNIEGFVPCGNPARITNSGLIVLKSYASEEELASQIKTTEAFIEHVSEHRGVSAHPIADVSDLSETKSQLLSALSAVAMSLQAFEDHQPEIMDWVYRSLASLEEADDASANAQYARYDEIQQKVNELSA